MRKPWRGGTSPRDVAKEEDFILQNAGEKPEEKGLQKRTWFSAVLLEQLTRATTLLWNGTGLDLMFVCSGISCLATTTRDWGSLEGGPSPIKVGPREGTKGRQACTRYYEPLIESAHSRSGKALRLVLARRPGFEGINTHRVGTYIGVGIPRVLIGYSTHDR